MTRDHVGKKFVVVRDPAIKNTEAVVQQASRSFKGGVTREIPFDQWVENFYEAILPR